MRVISCEYQYLKMVGFFAVLLCHAWLSSATNVTWQLFTNLQSSPAMIESAKDFTVHFSLVGVNDTQDTWGITLKSMNGTVIASRNGSGSGVASLPALRCHACAATWEATYFGTGSFSPKQTVFTPAWADGQPAPKGMWAKDNATSNGPQFALMKVDLPATVRRSVALESALFFATGDGPGRAVSPQEKKGPGGTRPLLGAYKAWIGKTLIGIGPGRSKCGITPVSAEQPLSPALCPNGVERVFDGFDATAVVSECLSPSSNEVCTITIEGYGYDQPRSPAQSEPIYRRVAAELVLRWVDGRSWSLTEATAAAADAAGSADDADGGESNAPLWQALDADSIYLQNLWAVGGGGHAHNNHPLGTSGNPWYYYPHEYIDLSRMPAGTPLSPPGAPQMLAGGSGGDGNGDGDGWAPAVSKPAFENLVVRPVPPVAVLSRQAQRGPTQVAPGHFTFDMGAEVQAMLTLSVAATFRRPLRVTVRFAEELLTFNATAGGAGWCPHGFNGCFEACETNDTARVGMPCYDMRTGSRFEDKWTLPASTTATDNDTNADAGAGVRSVQNHEYIEGRYGELLFNDSSITAADVAVGAWVVKARRGQDGAMSSSDDSLNEVFELCRYTSDATSLDLYSDSNARQRSADCMADDNTAMRLAYATSDSLALQRYMMEQALTICGTGELGNVKPGKDDSCNAEWVVLPLVMVRDDALMTGDLSFARKHFDRLVPSALGTECGSDEYRQPLSSAAANANASAKTNAKPSPRDRSLGCIDPATGLVNTSNVLIDWPSGMRDYYNLTVQNSVANAFGYYGLTTLAEIAGWLGRSADQAKFGAQAAKLKAAINARMFDGVDRFCDGACATVPHTSFHSSVYMLAFGAVADEHKEAVWKYVKSRIDPPFAPSPSPAPLSPSSVAASKDADVAAAAEASKANEQAIAEQEDASREPPPPTGWPPPPPAGVKWGMPCGTYVSQFVLQALYVGSPSDHGHAGLSVLTSDAKNGWVSMLKQGATTTMEMWSRDEKPNLTWSHVWSASPGFIIPWFLFGIQALEPGWAKLSIKPAPGALERGEYALPTIKGIIKAHFTTTATPAPAGNGYGRQLILRVVLPLGTEATVSLPLLGTPAEAALLVADGVQLQPAGPGGDGGRSDSVHGYTTDEVGSYWNVAAVGPGEHTFAIRLRI